MGADLLLVCWWTTKPDEVDFDKGRAELASVTFDDIEAIENFRYGEYDSDDSRYEDEEVFLAEIARPQMLDAISEVEACWRDGVFDRATDVYRFGPVKVLITGGTSWGDDPSDMFTWMTLIPDRIAVACGFFH